MALFVELSFIVRISKIHIFLEGHKILQNLHQLFVLCTASHIILQNFVAFSEYMNFMRNSFDTLILGQKACFLGPTNFETP